MSALFTILTVLIVIASILLVIVVLLQNGKGEGMASNFTSANQTLGVRQTADILEKVSWGLVTFILVVSIITSLIAGNKGATDTYDLEEPTELPSPIVNPSAPAEVPAAEAPATEAPAAEAPATEAPAAEAPAEPAN
jgi:preprotein translocase subunit SecG